MMTGLFPPTGGDAICFGHSIIDGMEQIRAVMGVCPQHDILWNQLTAREHLELFANLKGLEGDIEEEVSQRLKDVALTAAADAAAGSFSGGMKRRLSVAIALVGDPRIVFLDEPTTGMDPVSRYAIISICVPLEDTAYFLFFFFPLFSAAKFGT
jgi:ABC-type multidrug transport system ATPase subunit